MKKTLLAGSLLSALLCTGIYVTAQPRLGKDPLKDVVKAMTLDEKISLVIGTGMDFPGLPPDMQGPVVGQTNARVAGAAGTTAAIPRLGIPSIVLADGPAGLRITPYRGDSSRSYFCTAFPIGTLLASSWDTSLLEQVGAAMGNEVKEYGVDILLGPALNNQRNPLGGRNFEYYSEDPLVAGYITAAMVNGIQSQGVGTSIKHFVANNHEWNRFVIDVEVSERALREIYLRSFQWALQYASPWTVMSSYNKVNGTYTSERADLLTTVLRDEWGFDGLVMTDWFGGKDAVAQMNARNDLLMPGTAKQQKVLREAVQQHQLEEAVLDRNVIDILQIILKTPSFHQYVYSNHPDLKAHALVARKAAAEGMVLLKNKTQTLPLQKVQRVAVLGNTAYEMVTGGTGSGDVNEAYTVSLTEGLRASGLQPDTALENHYHTWIKEAQAKQPPMQNPFLLPPPIPEMDMTAAGAAELAGANDVAIVVIGRRSGEFADRKLEDDYYLSAVEKDLLQKTAAAFHARGKKMIVLLNIGGVMEIASWQNLADAVLLTWQPGQEAGNAIADVLTGKENPSGKLAVSFPMDYRDVPSSKTFPGTVTDPGDTANASFLSAAAAARVVYDEGIFTGYRYFNTFQKEVAYPFGYGLSYTRFDYQSKMPASWEDSVEIVTTVTNRGKYAGREVVQLYVSAPAKTVAKPLKELRAFGKTRLLQPGESQTLHFVLHAADLASFEENRSAWVADAGSYRIGVGASVEDIRQQLDFSLPREVVVEKVHDVLHPIVPVQELKPAPRKGF